MKQGLKFVVALALLFGFNSCTRHDAGGSCSTNDSNEIIKDYLDKLGALQTSDKAHFNKDEFLRTTFHFPYAMRPRTDIPNGQKIDLGLGIAEVDTFMKSISPNDVQTIRSFYVNKSIFADYLDNSNYDGKDTLCDKSRIRFFKFYFADDTTTKKISFVIVAYDSLGNYIYLPKNPQSNDYQVYNQIAPCPSVCPTRGQAEIDAIYTGTVTTSPRNQTNLGTIIPKPNSR